MSFLHLLLQQEAVTEQNPEFLYTQDITGVWNGRAGPEIYA